VSRAAVAAVVWVARRLIGLSAGLVAGLVVALHPLQFVASGTLLTETVTAVVQAAAGRGAVVFGFRSPAQVPAVAVVLLGVLTAVATMVRPTFWFSSAVTVVLLVAPLRRLSGRVFVTRPLLFLPPVVVIIGDGSCATTPALALGRTLRR
jgi:hypothetical protein